MGEVCSGSTILDILLGSHPEVQSAGELSCLPKALMGDGNCACGRSVFRCLLWSKVLKRWLRQGREAHVIERYAFLEREFGRSGSLPTLMMERRSRSRMLREYTTLTTRLFRSIQAVSRKPIIIDSSKNPARALALSMMPKIHFCVIHLVRDGRGVVYSRQSILSKTKRRALQEGSPVSTWRASLSWRWVNFLSGQILQADGLSGFRMRYEDITERTEATFHRIGSLLNLDLDAIRCDIENGKRIPVGHLLTGNRARMGKEIRLFPDVAWKSRLAERDRWIFRLLAGPALGKYGYSID